MSTEYVQKGMESAHYEMMEDEGSYWGEIPDVQGVWGKAESVEKCRANLKEAFEEWVIFRLRYNLDLPVTGGINLNIGEHAA